MSLSWLLRDERITSVIIGASSTAQIEENLRSLQGLDFSEEELTRIESLVRL